jgi:hypothetical protein
LKVLAVPAEVFFGHFQVGPNIEGGIHIVLKACNVSARPSTYSHHGVDHGGSSRQERFTFPHKISELLARRAGG